MVIVVTLIIITILAFILTLRSMKGVGLAKTKRVLRGVIHLTSRPPRR